MSYRSIFLQGFSNIPNELFKQFANLQFTADSFLIWLFLYQKTDQGETVLDIEQIEKDTNISEKSIYESINELLNHQLIRLKTAEDTFHKIQTIVDLSPTFDKLDQLVKRPMLKLNGLGRLSQLFEQELGRPLSPIELEELQKWIDEEKIAVELVELALKEAVLNQKKNFKYVGGILRNWQGKGYQQVADVENEKTTLKKGKILDIQIPLD
ncbi:MAG: DnaD domain protein [Streptococcaceae bacterium]|jgi:DNA replication protein|nr:DnaD domain protein [Streptococcaceae bacterium]MCH4178050.1 DnaD domain protein [Streptococcaceae bacterium]